MIVFRNDLRNAIKKIYAAQIAAELNAAQLEEEARATDYLNADSDYGRHYEQGQSDALNYVMQLLKGEVN